MMKFLKDSTLRDKLHGKIKNLSRARLLVLCEKLNLKGFQNLRKKELVDLLLDNESQLNLEIHRSWWSRYHVHVYGLLGVIITIFLWFWGPFNDPTDNEDSIRPYLEPELVIYKIDSAGIHYKYILKNIGVLPAKNLVFSQRTETGILAEFKAKQRDLAPKGEMEINNPMMVSISSIALKSTNKFILTASFDVKYGDRVEKYNSNFYFFLPLDEVKVGSFKYNDVRRREGKFSLDNFRKLLYKEFPQVQEKRKIRPEEIIDAHSYLTLIKLKDTSLNRSKYILDAGKSMEKDRFSLYLNGKNDLVFRIIDKYERRDSVFVVNQPNLFKYPWLINCEYAYGRDFALIRLFVNDSLAMEKRIRYKAELSSVESLAKNLKMGTDIEDQNEGVFMMAFLYTYKNLLSDDEKSEIINHIKNKEIKKWVEFSGKSNLSPKPMNN